LAVKEISKVRFDCLAGYARSPHIVLLVEELNWMDVTDAVKAPESAREQLRALPDQAL